MEVINSIGRSAAERAPVRNRPWLVNTAATFGAIHLYTQWFEHFHATPGSIIVAGIFTILIAAALIAYNRRSKHETQANAA